MKNLFSLSRIGRSVWLAAGLGTLLAVLPALAQQLTPGEISEFRNMVGNRIETVTILGGDYGVNGGSFSDNTGNNDTTIDLQKFGGSGDLGDPKPLWNLPIGWQPRLQGSLGYLTAHSNFNDSSQTNLVGTEGKIHDFSIEFGGGARLWFNNQFSIAPTIMGMYGYTENTFYPHGNANAAAWQPAAINAGLVGWTADTWTVRPALDLQYIYTWRRTIFTLSSEPAYFHTESFRTSNPNVSVNGDSGTWMNKIDVDIPLGVDLWGHELRTGGYFSRTEFYGDIKHGVNTDHLHEVHGRIVVDYLNQFWKVQWIGIGASYLWGSNFHGYSIGADIAFRF